MKKKPIVDENGLPIWQNGILIEVLKEKAAMFKDHNEFSVSPFSEMNPRAIAYCEERGWLEYSGDAIIFKKLVTTKRKITCDGFIPIGEKQKGDVFVDAISGPKDTLIEMLNKIKAPCWLVIFEENKNHKKVATEANFDYVGSKISSFAEIYGYYFRSGIGELFPRDHPKVSEYEKLGLTRLKLEKTYPVETAIASIKDKLETLPEFTNHYSNYNAKGSWSALALRGYKSSPKFIEKPKEMNKVWKDTHIGWENYRMRNTRLRRKFPEIGTLMKLLPGKKHRIRLMKLKSGGGELRRHTDLVDPDQGLSDGKLARIHLPVVTNEKVFFENWDWQGNHEPVNMKVGEAWYLDVRKPHRAVNDGDTERIHIVVDVVSNQQLRNLIC